MKHSQFYLLLAVILLISCGGNDATKSDQTITFESLQPRNLSEKSFELNATASSGLPVTFTSSDATIASINGKTVTLLKKGIVDITASQPGNSDYFEAPSIKRMQVINDDGDPNKENQTISFNLSVTEWKASEGELTLEATASSGLTVTFSSTHPNVLIVGNKLSLTYTGVHYDNDATIIASQAGNNEYNAAPNVSKILHVIHED